MIAVYVDDILIASRHEKEITKLGQKLSSHFEVKSLGEVNYCLGVEFTQGNGYIAMHQRGYVKDLLSRFGMTDSKPVATPIDASLKLERNESGSEEDSKLPYRELVGALTYLATTTRPDISFAASHLGQFNNCFSVQHWKAAKRVLSYLKGTYDLGLTFKNSSEPLRGFVDADWGSNPEDRHSYSGYIFMLNEHRFRGMPRNKKQSHSPQQSEYMALAECGKECIYLRTILHELRFETLECITILRQLQRY